MTTFATGAATHVGKVRSTNQDQLLAAPPVFVVADGMGGHTGGEVAAAIAVDTMARAGEVSSVDELMEMVQQANRQVVDRGRLEPELRGMGTTVVALVDMQVGDEARLGVVNVGDSRLYLRGDEGLVQLTEDHSLVESLVRDGRLAKEDAAHHPQRNILTRALGIDEMVLVDAWSLAPVVGDRYLLCSDGLFNEIEPDQIFDTLCTVEDPTEAAETLVTAAVKAGGRDNVTVVVVDVVSTDGDGEDPPADRVVATFKAVPDAVLHVDHALADAHRGSSDPHPDEIEVDRGGGRRPRFTWRLALFVGAVMLVLAILFVSLVAYARSSYFVGIDDDDVVIYRGQPDGVLWFDPTVEEPLSLSVSELDPVDLPTIGEGVEFDTLEEAQQYGEELKQRAALANP